MLISAKNISRDQNRVVELPLSKSESNRALMILHYSGIEELRNSGIKDLVSRCLGVSVSLSNSDDTVLLQKHLNAINQYIKDCEQGLLSVVCCPLTLDCHNAGTVFRFLMTAAAVAETQSRRDAKLEVDGQSQESKSESTVSILLTGSERMKSRPIDSLVDALRSLGVSIEYQGREGYPPILIGSTNLANHHVSSSSNNTCDPRDTWRSNTSPSNTRDPRDTWRSNSSTNLANQHISSSSNNTCDTRDPWRSNTSPSNTRDPRDMWRSNSSTNLANQHTSSSSNNTCDPRDPWRSNTSPSNTRDPRDMWRSNPCDPWRLEVSAEQSSQFASSLLLAAPLWKNGLELHLTGNLSSLPYIDMTIDMMCQCGIDVVRNDRVIMVKPGCYNVENVKVEPDWSAAAFWYEMASFSDDTEILLKNLNVNSLQADAAAMKMFESLGVETIAVEGGVVVGKTTRFVDVETQRRRDAKTQSSEFRVQSSEFNFKDCPDLFPAVIAACAGNKLNATFTGLKNLSIKESDRKLAMMKELSKINIVFEDVSDDELKMFCPEELPYFTEENPIVFNNYEDHRIAMALSVLSMKIGTISMENTDVVSKSYPGFFDTL